MIKYEELKRIKSWLKKKPMPPYQIEIKPTNKCNLKCITCAAMGKSEYNKKEELSFEVYKKMLIEAAKLGVKNIHITGGGEPLASDIVPDLMKLIKQLKMEGTVATSGTMFTEELIKELVALKWDNVAVSLDSYDEKTQDFIKGQKGAFKKAVQTIQLFTHYKKKLKKDKPDIEFRPVLNRYNYDKLVDYLKLAHSLNVREVYVQPLRVKNNNAGKRLMLSAKQKAEFKKSIPNLLKKASQLGININLDSFDDLLIEKESDVKEVIKSYTIEKPGTKSETKSEKKKKSVEDEFSSLPCYNPWFFISIRPNGDVYPCSSDMPKAFGNIKEHSIKDIWFSKKFDILRKGFINKNIPEYCSLCCGLNLLKTKKIQARL